MKAVEAQLLTLMNNAPQFAIPIYQRTYSWEEEQCRQLWDDIIRSGEANDDYPHFIGSIVYIQEGIFHTTNQMPLMVIDGQQRLTTVSLILAALAEKLELLPGDDQEPYEGFSPDIIRNCYLLNPTRRDLRYYKIILTQTDKETLMAICKKGVNLQNPSLRIQENYNLFKMWIDDYKGSMVSICRGIAKLMVVDVALNRGEDNPQLIFESMNSTGKELTQADLIRNYVLMDLEQEKQTNLYQQYWYPMECDFGQQAYNTYFDGFMRHYLTLKSGEIPRIDDVYNAFKKYHRSLSDQSIEALVKDIRTYSQYYCAMALDKETDQGLKGAFRDIRDLRVDVAYPFLLELYDDYKNSILCYAEFLEAVRLVESYVFRRAICSYATNSLNKTFATFSKALRKDSYLESIQAIFMLMKSYRAFPRDEEFKTELLKRAIYKTPTRCSYFLYKLENHQRRERVESGEYSIEHIMPQNDNLSQQWIEELGDDWERIHETYLHTVGNLTLTGYNSTYSDRPFAEKRDMEGGFRSSPLKMNEGLGQVTRWNEQAIIERAQRLSEMAIAVWKTPNITPEQLNQYQTGPNGATIYTLADYPILQRDKPNELYQAIRQEILGIDPEIREEILKSYIAFKANTNIVDIDPRSESLLVYINLPYDAMTEPRDFCRNVSKIGCSGNGDIEIRFSDLADLPFIMGLARKAFIHQMDNGDEE